MQDFGLKYHSLFLSIQKIMRSSLILVSIIYHQISDVADSSSGWPFMWIRLWYLHTVFFCILMDVRPAHWYFQKIFLQFAIFFSFLDLTHTKYMRYKTVSFLGNSFFFFLLIRAILLSLDIKKSSKHTMKWKTAPLTFCLNNLPKTLS